MFRVYFVPSLLVCNKNFVKKRDDFIDKKTLWWERKRFANISLELKSYFIFDRQNKGILLLTLKFD